MRRANRLPLEALQPYLLENGQLPINARGLRVPAQSASGNPPSPSIGQSAICNLQSAIPLAWRAVFGNDRPVEIEVGFGKGLFLLTAAALRPEVNFLGLEIERKYQLFTASRVAKRQLANVRLACADARSFMRDLVPSGSVQALHVFFPDPWWKQRHRKRRLFTPEFVEQCARVLLPGGVLDVVSDVAEYFGDIVALLNRHPRFQAWLPPPQPEDHNTDCLTNFERKYRLEGRPIHRAVFRAGEIRDHSL